MKPGEKYTVAWVNVRDLTRGPIRHLALSQEQLERIASVHAVFAEVDHRPLEEMVDNFQREINPDSEIALWEAMARVYSAFCSQRELTLEAKSDVLHLLLWRSMSSRAITLDRARLKSLGREEAEAVLDLCERG